MKSIAFLSSIIIALFFGSCSKDDPATLPTITTDPITSITHNSATTGGNVVSDGNGKITARGVVWSTYPNPAVNFPTKTNDGSGSGPFISEMTNLEARTIYYVKAYATNSAGTSYGEQINFKTDYQTVTDIENNVYKTIKIGNQIWMRENLKTTKYNDGTDIPLNTETASIEITTPAYSWYNNDKITYGNVFGALYNFYAVETEKLCPSGWHVPTPNDFYTLRQTIGGGNSFGIGGLLKEQGTEHWIAPNNGATNAVDFTGLPAGYKIFTYEDIGKLTFWWMSEDGGVFGVDQSTSLYNEYGSYDTGISVRCIKD